MGRACLVVCVVYHWLLGHLFAVLYRTKFLLSTFIMHTSQSPEPVCRGFFGYKHSSRVSDADISSYKHKTSMCLEDRGSHQNI